MCAVISGWLRTIFPRQTASSKTTLLPSGSAVSPASASATTTVEHGRRPGCNARPSCFPVDAPTQSNRADQNTAASARILQQSPCGIPPKRSFPASPPEREVRGSNPLGRAEVLGFQLTPDSDASRGRCWLFGCRSRLDRAVPRSPGNRAAATAGKFRRHSGFGDAPELSRGSYALACTASPSDRTNGRLGVPLILGAAECIASVSGDHRHIDQGRPMPPTIRDDRPTRSFKNPRRIAHDELRPGSDPQGE
jgi:hypothetical protein